MADEIRFAPKDAKIIKDNPDKSPYELKELGLSDPGFEKLMAQESTAKKVVADQDLEEDVAQKDKLADADKSSAEVTKDGSGAATDAPGIASSNNLGADGSEKKKLIPKLESPLQTAGRPKLKSHKGQVWVQTPAGKRNTMGETFARKLVKQDPRYKIIG